MVAVVKISQQEDVEAMTAVVGEGPEEAVEVVASNPEEAEVDEGEEDLVAQPSLQRTFLHRFLPDYRWPTFSKLLLDLNHWQSSLKGHYVLATVR